MLNNQLPPDTYPAYVQGMYADPPVVRRVPTNKSHKGTFKTTISDVGEAGPEMECLVEYKANHCPAEQTLDIEVLSVIAVYSVKLNWRENCCQNAVHSFVDFNERLACRHCDYLLNEHVEIEDRVADEIRQSLAG